MLRKLLTTFSAIILGTALWAVPDDLQWKASWITKQQSSGGTNSWIAFRRKLQLTEVPEQLTARIAVDTKYWMWVNDSLVVFEGGLKRGPAPGESYYDEVDIAPFLREGDNLIAILVWHLGKSGFSHQDSGSVGLLFDAQSPDGKVCILTDRSWEASEYLAYSTASGPVPNPRLPESNLRFDARREFVGWNTAAYTKRLGTPMVMAFRPGDAPFGKLVKRPVPLWKDYGMREYVGTRTSGDTLICRLPYNCHATPYFKVDAPAGRVIRMETDHRKVTGTECIRAEYVTRGGVQEYESLGWMNGEEMRYIIPSDVKVIDVKYRETGYDCELSGSFHCDDELLNEYWTKAQRTLYVCMRDTYYDCPDRERAQWWGDEVNELGEAFFALSRSADKLALKGIHELVNWQRADGAMYAPVPTSNYFCELPMQILASVGWYGFHNYWFYSGDDSFIAPVYDRLHRYLHETWQTDAAGLPIYRKGEWDWPDAGEHCDRQALLHPWYYLALKGELAFAQQLGKADDASQIEGMMTKLGESFNRIYWNGNEYRTPGYEDVPDDRVQAMAVVSGLASADKYPQLTRVLAEQFHATTYMQRYVIEALYMMGQPQLAIDRMHKLYPTVMKPECSTLWEHWDYDGTCNHAWTGGAIIEMGRKMAGIEPLEPGFRRFSIDPQMGPLKEIDTEMETNYGRIVLSARRSGRTITLKVSVPEGTQAEIPAAKSSEKLLGPGLHTVKIKAR